MDYYNAADVFIHTSLSEGSPVGVEKAFACGTPVLSTDVGYTAELMKEYNAGEIIPRTNYNLWEKKLIDIFMGTLPKPFDIELIIKHFSWPNVARSFIAVFNNI